MAAIERSPYFKTPAFQYIRESDRLPTTDDANAAGLDAVVRVKLFDPTGAGTWYITGYDPDTRIVSGGATLGYGVELGDTSMEELTAVRVRFGLAIERDLYWTPKPLRDVL